MILAAGAPLLLAGVLLAAGVGLAPALFATLIVTTLAVTITGVATARSARP